MLDDSMPNANSTPVQQWQQRGNTASGAGIKGDPPVKRAPAKKASSLGNGVLILLALNFGLFFLDHVAHVSWMSQLYLHVGRQFHWWQLVTSAFCHASFHHLSSNMFMLYVFGKTVEEDEGAVAVLISYLLCAIGAHPVTVCILLRPLALLRSLVLLRPLALLRSCVLVLAGVFLQECSCWSIL